MVTLAQNVYVFRNMPNNIDMSYVNKQLLIKGAVAFFYDEVMKELLALPFSNVGKLDVYGRPTSIQVIGKNGYTRALKKDEYVIMYDNMGKYPLYVDICQYAERMGQIERTTDINVHNQKTARFWKTSADKEKTIKDLVNNVDGYNETVITYDNILTDDTEIVLQPAPFVTDKLDDHKDRIWNEFLRLIGISNISFNKKERLIQDEIRISQGGTIASRYNRFETRYKAIEEINKKFGHLLEDEIIVEYYDGLPTSLENDSIMESESEEIGSDIE
ncbi:MAG: hypothetical protein MJ224_02060 [archaeon]|nr:hypothetical protein [archaeon]